MRFRINRLLLAQEVGGVDQGDGLFASELVGAWSGKQDVARFRHHASGETDWIFHRRHAGHRTAAVRFAVHHGRIEFGATLVGQYRSSSGIEHRVVFENANHQFDSVEGRVSRRQGVTTSCKRPIQSLAS